MKKRSLIYQQSVGYYPSAGALSLQVTRVLINTQGEKQMGNH